MYLSNVVEQLRSERERLNKELRHVDNALKALGGLMSSDGASRPRRSM